MSNVEKLIDELLKDPRVKNLGLKKEAVVDILRAFNDLSLKSLLENGNLDIGNGLYMDIVKLAERVHVLRGVSYRSSRKYKLKLTMDDNIYKKIEDYYDNLMREIQ